jgi:hypothetical protein
MDLQITPEPTPEEREAILRALELEREPEPSPWQRAALEAEDDEDYATAPPRQSRGATRA